MDKLDCTDDEIYSEAPSEPAVRESKVYNLAVPNLDSQTQHEIARTVVEIGRMLLDKNRKYGDSALKPLRIHSKSDSLEQMRVRADDKLSRLLNPEADEDEDVLLDYIGYMVLLLIAERNKK